MITRPHTFSGGKIAVSDSGWQQSEVRHRDDAAARRRVLGETPERGYAIDRAMRTAWR
ncbi:hypothetical protein [Amycolatopsis pithecellobii]|uniref:Uncharacterized protein n=1 Tax=Amycolatopsis pithecellobii TaxID=664692 RepID=A0A6N7Z9Q8_9PSEU|nr:hypothetical protein [Amycolatopsis pithecellobii]MTD58463.1 hypothetical protein [Amycolatopsis pithecellobii]